MGSGMKRACVMLAWFALGTLVAASGLWGSLALFYFNHLHEIARFTLAAAFAFAALTTLIALAVRRLRWRALCIFAALLGTLIISWRSIEPSNDREWQADVAVLPFATIEGDAVTVHNIRNFAYRSEFDYTPSYYDKRFALSELEGVDLIAVYWMGPAIAHVFLSFAFTSGDHLAISIEARKERSEGYSTIKGFFRQYELYYVVADERDVIGLRTNYRRDPPEDVYLFRLQGPVENGRKLFIEYMRKINALKVRPEFYNTLSTNCTTNIWLHSRVNPQHLAFNWKILASGYVPEYLYESGRLAHDMPFEELKERAHVNMRARTTDDTADFSRRIRDVGMAANLR